MAELNHLASETEPAAEGSFSQLSRQLLLIDREERGEIISLQSRFIKSISAKARRNLLPLKTQKKTGKKKKALTQS